MAFLAPLAAPLLEGGAAAAGGAAAEGGAAAAGGAAAEGGAGAMARTAGGGMMSHFSSGHGESRSGETGGESGTYAPQTNPVFN
ncbi:hypothetical protein [Streptomyces sp. NPDC004528]|uniref:hypothetical protein n=1 Tax=Streptomyces sp. NPDC004528 TaxID=3154550 RepID=UPI0033A53329